jgi:uncharacterized Zn-binding protein involved in type VI secretion
VALVEQRDRLLLRGHRLSEPLDLRARAGKFVAIRLVVCHPRSLLRGFSWLRAGASLSCPSSNQFQLAVGSDYELTGGGPLTYVSRLITAGAGMINGSAAAFFVVNFGTKSGAFRPHIGCVPLDGTQAVQSSRVNRIREVRLHRSQAASYSDSCRHGERLVRGFAGVLFEQRRPPTLRQLGEVTFTDRRVGQGIRVSVRTGRGVGSHQRVELQITAICRR